MQSVEMGGIMPNPDSQASLYLRTRMSAIAAEFAQKEATRGNPGGPKTPSLSLRELVRGVFAVARKIGNYIDTGTDPYPSVFWDQGLVARNIVNQHNAQSQPPKS
jgi:hypothetical protein